MAFIKLFVLVAVCAFAASCGSGPAVSKEPIANTNEQSKRVEETVASHSVERDGDKLAPVNPVEPSASNTGGRRKWSRSGDPIDTSGFDNAIVAAEKEVKKKSDAASKKVLGTAYFERAVALTAARQYASAIGDFRKAVENDPENADAKKQIAMITSIYDSMNIEVPGVGEEPAPLEFKKEKD